MTQPKLSLSNIFKAYDIRGITPTELNPHVAHSIGRAFADFMPKGKIAVGRDMREDSDELAHGLIAGLLRQGREVIDLGQITSDTMYFAVGKYGYAGGAMITASHNPGKYDGIKLTGKNVVPIGIDSGLLKIEKEIETHQYKKMCSDAKAKNIIEHKDITKEWVEHALGVAGQITKPINIGIDTGNGMAAIYLPYLKELTPLKIRSIYTKLDGSFPNHPANPLEPNNTKHLQELVINNHLHCGIAFDGDGDRAFFIDEKGQRVSASILGTILAEHIIDLHPHATVLYNVIISHILPETVNQLGGEAIRTKVGHSFIKQQMKLHKAQFAAEHSGHYYYKDNYNADSGLITALMVLSILSQKNIKLSELANKYQKYFNSPELNFETNNIQENINVLKNHFKDGKLESLDGITIVYKDWWFNARPSNTEPFLRVNIEAKSQELLNEKTTEIKNLLHQKRKLTI